MVERFEGDGDSKEVPPIIEEATIELLRMVEEIPTTEEPTAKE